MSDPPGTWDFPTTAEPGPPDGPTIPGYTILAELGRGGMGVVYTARQDGSGRLVAVKVIRDGELAGPRERARFRIESEAAARMRHPNVVQVYDVGESAGRPYIAMELVEGGSLDRHLAGRPLPARAAADLVRTLAHAVDHAHGRQIIHRDLKPANILLSRTEDAVGTLCPKITDFGLAKRLDTESTALTQDGAVVGTAGYMAPEQAAGRVGEIGPPTDVYALGGILYEVLTGHPPFRAEVWAEAVRRVLQDEPTPPTQLDPNVPPDLEVVCLKCLEKEPGRRYATAGELAADLGRFLDGAAVTAVPPAPAERLARLARKDGYRIVGELGRGPRSTVYRALTDPLDRPVMVKVFPQGACTREAWEDRLRSAATLWAVIAHPHVVTVERAGWWGDTPYLVMECAAHGSLAAAIADRPYSTRTAIHLVGQLAELVGYLHRQGVVHSNLKPSNVLLAADGIPRVTDFRPTGGLFQGSLPDGDQDPAGLGYLAPELIREPAAEARPYTDVYGLGLILYELLTGRPAFTGTSAQAVVEDVLTRDPIPPSQLNPVVTLPLDAICLRCLRKDPWRRYVRAYDLFTRLRRLADEPDGWSGPSAVR